MTPNRVTVAIEKYKPQIPSGYEGMFRNALEEADDRCMDEFMFLPIKRKGVTLALSLFLGHLGLDHFYLGNKKKGVMKLACFVMTTILSSSNASGATALFGIALGIWCLVDIFKNHKRATYINYYGLSGYLYDHPYKELPAGATSTATLNTASSNATAKKGSAKAKSTAAAKSGTSTSATSKPYTPATVPSNEKYSPIKVNTPVASKSTGKKTVQPAPAPAPLPSIDEAMSAYAKSFESNNGALSLDDLADLAAAKSTLDSASVQNASEKNTKKDVPAKVDLTFSNITVNPSLAKDLGFEDFNESAIGGARHGR